MKTISEYIEKRWSPRAFDGQAIDPSVLKELFIAAGRAPSSSNEQPWRFMVGEKGSSTYDKIYETLVDFNKAWVKTANVLVIGIYKKISEKTQQEATHAAYDLGAAVAHLSMCAYEHGLYVHQMGGFDPKKCDELFELPEGYATKVAFTIGYPGDKSQLHEKIAALEKGVSSRNAIEEYVFEEKFGQSKF
jgi:nitroreductase